MRDRGGAAFGQRERFTYGYMTEKRKQGRARKIGGY